MLGRDFFSRLPTEVAPELVGAILLRTLPNGQILKARIVEVEAYLPEGDAAAHHARYGQTPARQALFMGPGTIYIHAMRAYVGMDIVTAGIGNAPGSVLLRAAEPLEGFEHPSTNLMNGPGKLCRALGIDRSLNTLNITEPTTGLTILPGARGEVVRGPRIGVRANTDLYARYWLAGSPYVSKAKRTKF